MKANYVHKDTLTATDYVELNKNNELLISYNQALLEENKQIKEENQKLKSQLAGTTHCYDEEEHRKLENNWNELKRWLYEDHCLYVPEIARNLTYQKVLEKMYEIEKESNSNEI